MDYQSLINELLDIGEELFARETTSNSIYERYQNKSWHELCGRAIAILEEIDYVAL